METSSSSSMCSVTRRRFISTFFSSVLKRVCCSAVAVQCLETAFEVSTDDQSLSVPMTLPEIFASATAKVDCEEQSVVPC